MKLKKELMRELQYILSKLRSVKNFESEIKNLLENSEISQFQRNILLKFSGKFDYHKENFDEFTQQKKNLLKLRRQINKKRPIFRLFGYLRLKRIPKCWRKPRGSQSKQRRCVKGRPKMAGVGYRGPRNVRGLNSKGYQQIRIFNLEQLKKIENRKKDLFVEIASCVGLRNRIKLENYGVKKNIYISNPFIINTQ